MKQQLIVRKSIGSNTKKVEKINSIEGHKDMQKLNTLMYEQEAINQQPVMSSSTDEGMESYIAGKNTLIEILSRTIARIDVIEATLKRHCKNYEKHEKIAI